MKILMAASECTPFVKTGGLADVVGTLPLALARGGDDVRVILPYYRDIPQYWKEQTTPICQFYVNLGWRRQYCGVHTLEREGVKYYFIDNEFYFARDNVYGTGQEEGERFGFFCRAVLEALIHLQFRPDIIHCHDWQAGMIPTLLCTQYQHDPFYMGMKTIFTIHNLRYQGIFTWKYIEDMLGIDEQYFRPDMLEYYGLVSFIKAGIVFSDAVTTVSPTYAQEIQTAYYGERLDGLMRARCNHLHGILNGIDPTEYDPQTDMWLPSHFSATDFAGKASCKADLQRELGLNEVPDVPIVCMITRLCDQKGLDLVECVLDDIMRMDLQLVILGKGDEHYQDLFSWAAWRYQGRLATRIELNNPLSHRLFAASDIVLIPSQFEPCGLTQMIAMRYGTIPIVRETGGLKDSVIPFNKFTGEGNGFSFANYNAHEMLFTIERAIGYYCDTETWQALMRRAMKTNFSWDVSAQCYKKLYLEHTGVDQTTPPPSNDQPPRARTLTHVAQAVMQDVQRMEGQVKEASQKATQTLKQAAQSTKHAAVQLQNNTQQLAQDMQDKTQDAVTNAAQTVKEGAKKAKEAGKQTARTAKQTSVRTKKAAQISAKNAGQEMKKAAKTLEANAKTMGEGAKKAVEEGIKRAARGRPPKDSAKQPHPAANPDTAK